MWSARVSIAGRFRLSATPRARAIVGRDELRVAHRFQRHEPDAVGEVVRRRGRDLQRQPGLAGAARARSGVSSRVPPRSATASPSSLSRPTNVVSWVGRLFGRASSDRGAGKSPGRPSMTSWARRSGARRSLSRCSPRSRRPRPSGRAPSTRARVVSLSSTWPPCATAGDPRRPVDRIADDVGAGRFDVAGVQPHADADDDARRARVRRRSPVAPSAAAAMASIGAAEDHEERVALGALLVAVVCRERGPQQLAMPLAGCRDTDRSRPRARGGSSPRCR